MAICDQLEDPKQTKTIVKRGVTELVTPGVALNDEVLKSKSNNFLCAIYFDKKNIGVSFLDISTGEFLTSQGNAEYIDKLLQNFKPSEVLVSKQMRNEFMEIFGKEFHTFYLEDWVFQTDYAYETLTKHFQTNTLKGFGIEEMRRIASLIVKVLSHSEDRNAQENVYKEVREMCRRFPIPGLA